MPSRLRRSAAARASIISVHHLQPGVTRPSHNQEHCAIFVIFVCVLVPTSYSSFQVGLKCLCCDSLRTQLKTPMIFKESLIQYSMNARKVTIFVAPRDDFSRSLPAANCYTPLLQSAGYGQRGNRSHDWPPPTHQSPEQSSSHEVIMTPLIPSCQSQSHLSV